MKTVKGAGRYQTKKSITERGEISMIDMNRVGKCIKNARTNKNMTQLELADIVGVSYQAVSNWERGVSLR